MQPAGQSLGTAARPAAGAGLVFTRHSPVRLRGRARLGERAGGSRGRLRRRPGGRRGRLRGGRPRPRRRPAGERGGLRGEGQGGRPGREDSGGDGVVQGSAGRRSQRRRGRRGVATAHPGIAHPSGRGVHGGRGRSGHHAVRRRPAVDRPGRCRARRPRQRVDLAALPPRDRGGRRDRAAGGGDPDRPRRATRRRHHRLNGRVAAAEGRAAGAGRAAEAFRDDIARFVSTSIRALRYDGAPRTEEHYLPRSREQR